LGVFFFPVFLAGCVLGVGFRLYVRFFSVSLFLILCALVLVKLYLSVLSLYL